VISLTFSTRVCNRIDIICMPNVHSNISIMAKLGAIKLSVLQVLEALEFFLCFSDCQSYCPSED
jgi:hypothetical protein